MSLVLVMLCLLTRTMSTRPTMFRTDNFKDYTEECKSSEGKPIRFIMNEDNPAMYIGINPASGHWHRESALADRLHLDLMMDQMSAESAYHDLLDDFVGTDPDAAAQGRSIYENMSFDCVLHFETQLPIGDKMDDKYDALSLIILDLEHNEKKSQLQQQLLQKPQEPSDMQQYISSMARMPDAKVEIVTLGHEGYVRKKVTKRAAYSDSYNWPNGHNPNFLLSGQLSGFESVDIRTKIDSQHIVKPENLHSTFDRPAMMTINLTQWAADSRIYMVVTSYKYLRRGSERCQERKEFDCASPNFLSNSFDHMCMNVNLACDGIPNCGQDILPNQDENCFKIHWSSVLLSLVSYILLAITLLLCLSCFARALIQWSVRSSLVELRGMHSPTASFRSSTRFFSFLGTTLATRWERPPPTYDEAMKHINPDLDRPPDPPPYCSADSSLPNPPPSAQPLPSAAPATQLSDEAATAVISHSPPPEYRSQEGLHPIIHSVEVDDRRRHHHHHHHHRRHHSRHTASSASQSQNKVGLPEHLQNAEMLSLLPAAPDPPDLSMSCPNPIQVHREM